MKVPPDHWCDWKHCELDGDESHPCKPVQLSEKLQIQLTLLDEAVRVDDEEESEGDVQVECDVCYGHQASPHLCVQIIIDKSPKLGLTRKRTQHGSSLSASATSSRALLPRSPTTARSSSSRVPLTRLSTSRYSLSRACLPRSVVSETEIGMQTKPPIPEKTI